MRNSRSGVATLWNHINLGQSTFLGWPLSNREGGVPECLYLARGRFFTNPKDASQRPSWYPDASFIKNTQWWKSGKPQDSFFGAGLHLSEEPELLVVIPITRSQDTSALSFAAHYVAYNRPIAKRAARSAREPHNIVLNIAFLTGDQTDPTKVPAATLDLGRMTPGHEIVYYTPEEFAAEIPDQKEGNSKQNANNEESTTFNKLPVTSGWLPIHFDEAPKPVTVWVQIADTEEPNEFLAFLGRSLDASKEGVGEAIETALVPGKSDEAKLKELQAQDELRGTYNSALTEAEKALDAYEGAGGKGGGQSTALFVLASTARTAQEKANTAAFALGKDTPYKTLVDPGQHRVDRNDI